MIIARLAVDFFFFLSGFVIAEVYDRRFEGGYALTRFAEARAVRLYPMVLFGVALGTAASLVIHVAAPTAAPYFSAPAPHVVAVEALLAVFFVPVMFRIFGVVAPVVFPLDGPLWSLMCELAANAVYGLGAKFGLRNAWPALAAISGAALLLYSAKHNTVNGGDLPTTLFDGFLRVGFGFFAGATISRFKGIAPGLRAPGWLLFGGLAAILLVPHVGRADGLFENLSVFVAFPVIVLVGSRLETPPKLEPIMAWGGRISYPLYLVHGPILRCLVPFEGRLPTSHLGALALALALAVAAVGTAHVIMVSIDEPARRWLTNRLRLRRLGEPNGSPATVP